MSRKQFELKSKGKRMTEYISIDDVMSVFDDYMRGDVDEEDIDTFLEMLKDRAEGEEYDKR